MSRKTLRHIITALVKGFADSGSSCAKAGKVRIHIKNTMNDLNAILFIYNALES